MSRTKFEKIIIIGYGRITAQVLSHVCEKRAEYGYEVAFIEHETASFSTLRKTCEEQGVLFYSEPDKVELARRLDAVREETLILSVSNNFLFPAALVAKPNVTIVNFHNALLPRFPGRNAPSWVIYQGERETGITWHYVTAGVDEGSIILQKRCAIGPDTKAYELADSLMTLAYEGFCQCFPGILEEEIRPTPQENISGRRMYRSWEVPGGGHFDTEEAPEGIYRLLRATDYGKNDIFPKITATYQGKEIRILRYRKVEREKAEKEGAEGKNLLYLPLDESYVLKIKYEETEKIK